MDNRLSRVSMDRMDSSLIETLLSYLSLTDKTKFECLSKRVQKLIFNSVTELRLTRWNQQFSSLFSAVQVCDFATAVANRYEWNIINKQYLKTILSKCKNVDKIDLDFYVQFDDLMIIGQLCPNLKNLALQCIGLNVNDLDQFGRQYGHRLNQMYFHSQSHCNEYWSQLLKHCPNVTHLWSSDVLKLGICDDINYVPKLEVTAIEICNYTGRPYVNYACLQLLTKFVNKYGSTLKNLYLESFIKLSGDNMHQLADGLSKLVNLQELNLEIQTNESLGESEVQELMDGLKHMKSLKKLYIVLDVYGFDCDHFIQSFNGLESLAVLNINSGNSIVPYNITTSNVKCFNTMKSLKELVICCKTISEDFFVDIGRHLPNLSQVIIQCESPITDRTLIELSLLKKLKKLYLSYYKANHKQITDSGVCALITGCSDIHCIHFSSRPRITHKTIEALISCAKQFPKRVIKFNYGFLEVEDINQYPIINLDNFANLIPSNLIIELQ